MANAAFTLFRVELSNEYVNMIKFLQFILWAALLANLALGAGSPKKKPAKKSTLEEVNSEALHDVLEDNDEVLVLFYEDNKSPNCRKLVTTLEKFDLSDLPDLSFVRISDLAEAEEFGIEISELPRVVLFQNSIPDEYTGDILDIKALKTWVKDELDSTDVDELDLPTMEKVVAGGSPFVIMFVDDPKRELNSEAAILKVGCVIYNGKVPR